MWNVTIANDNQALVISLKIIEKDFEKKLEKFSVSDREVYLTFAVSKGIDLDLWYRVSGERLCKVAVEYCNRNTNQRYDIYGAPDSVKDWLESLLHFATQQYEEWLVGAKI